MYYSLYGSYFFNRWSRIIVPGSFTFILSYGLIMGFLSRKSASIFNEFGGRILQYMIFAMILRLIVNLQSRIARRHANKDKVSICKVLTLLDKVKE